MSGHPDLTAPRHGRLGLGVVVLRLSRIEIATSILLAAAIGGAVWVFARDLAAVCPAGAPRSCFGSPAFFAVSREPGSPVASLIGVFPFIAGTLLGAPLISRELEHRTALTAWGLSGSRLRWLALRSLPPVIVLVLLSAAMGLAGEYVSSIGQPTVEPGKSLLDYGTRGPLVVARAAFAFCGSVLVGLLLGRLLPALVVSGALAIAILVASDALRLAGITPQELRNRAECRVRTCIGWDEALRTPDGRFLLTSDLRQAAASDGVVAQFGNPAFQAWIEERDLERVTIAVTGNEYPALERRDLLITLTATALVVVATLVALGRRRVGG